MIDQGVIILCPGQGAQHVGMGKPWAAKHPAAKAVFDEADAVLGVELSRLCFDGPEQTLNGTDMAQAAIYTTTIACWRALCETGQVDGGSIAATAGLSLGEYTALHLAGVFSFTDGLNLVWQRGHFMQAAATATASGMVALIGADEAQADQLCDAARGNDVLVPANYNCPGQIVISGSAAACDRAMTHAEQMGLRATRLTVAGAFHSPLMKPAADRMAHALDAVEFQPPRTTVLSNVTGSPHGQDTAAIKQLLVEQIVRPVRWEHDVRWLLGNAAGRYIEPAPGKVLSGLMRRIDRQARVENFAEPA